MPPHVLVSSQRASHRKLPSPKSIFNHHNSRASPEEQQKPCPQPSNLTFPSLSLDFLPPLSPQQNPSPPPPLAFPSLENYLHIHPSIPLQAGVLWVQSVLHTCYTLTTDLVPVGRPFLGSEMPNNWRFICSAPSPGCIQNSRDLKKKPCNINPTALPKASANSFKEITLAQRIAVPWRSSLGVFGERAEWMLNKASPDGSSTVITGDPPSLGQRNPSDCFSITAHNKHEIKLHSSVGNFLIMFFFFFFYVADLIPHTHHCLILACKQP